MVDGVHTSELSGVPGIVTPMSIDDIPRPNPFSVDHWRAVMHDAVDQVLDEILEAAESEWCGGPDDDLFDEDLFEDEDDEPPGDPPSAEEISALGTQLRESLTAAIAHGTRFWGCDGTLRCTGQWAERYRLPREYTLDHYRRADVLCDCAVLNSVPGHEEVRMRCPLRAPVTSGDGPAPPSSRP